MDDAFCMQSKCVMMCVCVCVIPKNNNLQVGEKYVNIPSEKYIYVHIYVCICVYTYLCKMDERRSYASLS